jgi:hypothetical protein
MGFFAKLAGITNSFFQIGGPGGNGWNYNSAGGTALEARNAANSTFVVVRGAAPVADNDLTTKAYVDVINKPIVVGLQFNGNNPLPANSGTEQFYVVTTTGANATIGQLLWDDGSGIGTVTVLTALEGRSIFTSAAFSGGTISLRANSYYVWDTVSSSWLLEASSTQSGAVRVIRYAITNAAVQDSATTLPANAVVLRAWLDVVTPYSGGATISIGQAGFTSAFMGTGDNTATVADIYQVSQDTVAPALTAIRTSVGGAPAAGAGFTIVEYSVPDN